MTVTTSPTRVARKSIAISAKLPSTVYKDPDEGGVGDSLSVSVSSRSRADIGVAFEFGFAVLLAAAGPHRIKTAEAIRISFKARLRDLFDTLMSIDGVLLSCV
jgi:hypothetical protein